MARRTRPGGVSPARPRARPRAEGWARAQGRLEVGETAAPLEAARPSAVVLPAPDAPSSAVTRPARASGGASARRADAPSSVSSASSARPSASRIRETSGTAAAFRAAACATTPAPSLGSILARSSLRELAHLDTGVGGRRGRHGRTRQSHGEALGRAAGLFVAAVRPEAPVRDAQCFDDGDVEGTALDAQLLGQRPQSFHHVPAGLTPARFLAEVGDHLLGPHSAPLASGHQPVDQLPGRSRPVVRARRDAEPCAAAEPAPPVPVTQGGQDDAVLGAVSEQVRQGVGESPGVRRVTWCSSPALSCGARGVRPGRGACEMSPFSEGPVVSLWFVMARRSRGSESSALPCG
ncbi:hypothetical protein SVIOM342S_04025 [Streptomyces violaceorubidus]